MKERNILKLKLLAESVKKELTESEIASIKTNIDAINTEISDIQKEMLDLTEEIEVLNVNLELASSVYLKQKGIYEQIFIGRYSSEPVGDYFAGPNHVLPTNGTARFSSPLNVDDFQKKSSIIMYSKEDFEQNAHKIAAFARMEGLEAHARAIEVRNKEK